MAATLAQNGTSLALSYDDRHQRIRQVTTGPAVPVTTDYLNDPASGAMSLRVTTGTGLPVFTDYITLDGQVVAQRSVQYAGSPAWGAATWNAFNWGSTNWSGVAWGGFKWGAAPWSGPVVNWAYFTLDHLGSVAVVANQSGNVVQRLSYDAWGKQRHADGTDTNCGGVTSPTTRGFTNQEQMPAGCIVNLNARLYDPSIGKFMAADSIVLDAFDGQSYNRYAYVMNNPLSFVDPTGHLESVVDTGFRSPFPDAGPSFAPGAAINGSSSYGPGYGDSDPASPHSTPAKPPATVSQQNQTSNSTKQTYFPPSLCSRAGGGGNNGCSGDYASSITVTINSSGKSTKSYENTGGSSGETNAGGSSIDGRFYGPVLTGQHGDLSWMMQRYIDSVPRNGVGIRVKYAGDKDVEWIQVVRNVSPGHDSGWAPDVYDLSRTPYYDSLHQLAPQNRLVDTPSTPYLGATFSATDQVIDTSNGEIIYSYTWGYSVSDNGTVTPIVPRISK